MSMRTRNRTQESPQSLEPQTLHADPALTPPADTSNVMVSYGTHRMRFPIGGMSVRDARQVLAKLLNIDASAVAVINGRTVDENTTIAEDITMLSFVKPASIRGFNSSV